MATQTPPTPPPTRARPKMTVYGGGRPPKKRKRRWVRVALWTLGSFLVVLLASAGIDDVHPEDFRRYGSARKLYNFSIDNASAY